MMKFTDVRCPECGVEFGEAKPGKVTKVKAPYFNFGRFVELVAACPSCGKKVPVWEGLTVAAPEPAEPTEPTE